MSDDFKSPWRKWIKLTNELKITEENIELIQKETHKKNGVYVVKVSKSIKRVKGKSDIVYIGRGVLNNRLRRLLKLFPAYVTKKTKKQRLLFARKALLNLVIHLNADVWVTYKITDRHKELEKELLQRYQDDHIELPPLNRSST